MRWDELDLAGSTWIIPGTKMKNGEPMRIHLTEKAKQIIEARKAAAEKSVADGDTRCGEWVFPSKRFGAQTPHLVEPKAGWKRILDCAKIKDLRVHDPRRTLGSWQALLGASLPIIGKSLGHLDQQATQIYARLQLDPVRASVDAAATAIMAASVVKDQKPAPTTTAQEPTKSRQRRSASGERRGRQEDHGGGGVTAGSVRLLSLVFVHHRGLRVDGGNHRRGLQ